MLCDHYLCVSVPYHHHPLHGDEGVSDHPTDRAVPAHGYRSEPRFESEWEKYLAYHHGYDIVYWSTLLVVQYMHRPVTSVSLSSIIINYHMDYEKTCSD